jgi:hypothetical protein
MRMGCGMTMLIQTWNYQLLTAHCMIHRIGWKEFQTRYEKSAIKKNVAGWLLLIYRLRGRWVG